MRGEINLQLWSVVTSYIASAACDLLTIACIYPKGRVRQLEPAMGLLNGEYDENNGSHLKTETAVCCAGAFR